MTICLDHVSNAFPSSGWDIPLTTNTGFNTGVVPNILTAVAVVVPMAVVPLANPFAKVSVTNVFVPVITNDDKVLRIRLNVVTALFTKDTTYAVDVAKIPVVDCDVPTFA